MAMYDRLGSEFVVNNNIEGNQAATAAAALGNGNFVICWTDQSDIHAQIFNADGTEVGNEFIVNAQRQYSQIQPDIAPLSNGGFVVTWSDDAGNFANPQTRHDIKAQIFDDSGKRIGDTILVNDHREGVQWDPRVTRLPNGGFAISWSDLDGGQHVKAQIFNQDGEKVGQEIAASPRLGGTSFGTTIAALDDGKIIIGWNTQGLIGDGHGDGVIGQIVTADGSFSGEAFVINTITEGTQRFADFTTLAGGGFIAVWEDYSEYVTGADFGEIRGQIFDGSGKPVGTEILINPETKGSQTNASVAALPDGGFVVSWTDTNGIAGGILADDSSAGIAAQAFDALGNKVGDEFLVNTVTFQSQAYPTVAGLANGGFVIAWEDMSGLNGDPFRDVRAQIYNINGDSDYAPPPESAQASTSDSEKFVGAQEQQDIFFFDNFTPDGEATTENGKDVIRMFGKGDVVVLTEALYDSNNDGVIGFGSDKLMNIGSGFLGSPSHPGGAIKLFNEAGRQITKINYLGQQEHDGVDYYLYGLPGTVAPDLVFA